MRAIFLSAAALLTEVLANPVGASDISVIRTEGDFAFLAINGEILVGDANRFNVTVAPYARFAVFLNSDGGAAAEGMLIGSSIRDKRGSTVILDGQRCASACALIFAAGVDRAMQAHSLLGAHAVYLTGSDGAPRETGAGNALVGAYLTKLGFGYQTVLAMTSAAPTGMAWMTPDEARQAGLGVATIDANAHVVVAASGALEPVPQAHETPPVSVTGSFPLVPGGLQATLTSLFGLNSTGAFAHGVITASDLNAYCARNSVGDDGQRCLGDYASAVGAEVEVHADCTRATISYSFRGRVRVESVDRVVRTVNFDQSDGERMIAVQWNVLCGH